MHAVTGDLCTHVESVHTPPLPFPSKVLVLRFCSAADCFLSAEAVCDANTVPDLGMKRLRLPCPGNKKLGNKAGTT